MEMDKEEVQAVIQTLQRQRNQALDELVQASVLINKLQKQLAEKKLLNKVNPPSCLGGFLFKTNF